MIKVYGLKNCDTCCRALKWLAEAEVEHAFADFRQDPPIAADINHWISELGLETLLNRRSRAWRRLKIKSTVNFDKKYVVNLLLEEPTLMKRPIFCLSKRIIAGFNKEQRDRILEYAIGETP